MSEYGAVTILQLTGVDIELLSINIISYWNSQGTGTILQLLLEIMGTPRLCGTLSRKSCANPQLSPHHISPIDLVNTFGHFFSDKIAKIRVALKSSVPVSLTRPNSNSTALSSFEPVSEGDILKILKSSTTKSCDLDPIPPALVKEFADILVTPIANIITTHSEKGASQTVSKPHMPPPFSRNLIYTEISSKITDRYPTSVLYPN